MFRKLLGAIAPTLFVFTAHATAPDTSATPVYVFSQEGRPVVHLVLEPNRRHTAARMQSVITYRSSCEFDERAGLTEVKTAEVKTGDTFEIFSEGGAEAGDADVVRINISHAVLNEMKGVHTTGCSIDLPKLTTFSATHSMRLKVGEEVLIYTDEATKAQWTVRRTN